MPSRAQRAVEMRNALAETFRQHPEEIAINTIWRHLPDLEAARGCVRLIDKYLDTCKLIVFDDPLYAAAHRSHEAFIEMPLEAEHLPECSQLWLVEANEPTLLSEELTEELSLPHQPYWVLSFLINHEGKVFTGSIFLPGEAKETLPYVRFSSVWEAGKPLPAREEKPSRPCISFPCPSLPVSRCALTAPNGDG